MADYRRWFLPGGTYFFTLVTEGRSRLFVNSHARNSLHAAIAGCRDRWPFELEAVVLLPDHLHMVWTLPSGDMDYPRRLAALKRAFTASWLADGGLEQAVGSKRQHRRQRGVWQRRYWEHTIRDEADFAHHLDYIHYNPVKHGLATCPHVWPHSSFRQWVQRHVYDSEWGCVCRGRDAVPMRFQERSYGE